MPQYEQMDLLMYLEDMEVQAAAQADRAEYEERGQVVVRRLFSVKERIIKFGSRSLNKLQSLIFSSIAFPYPVKPVYPAIDDTKVKYENASVCLSSVRKNNVIPSLKGWGSLSTLWILKAFKSVQILSQQRFNKKALAICKSSEKRIEKTSESNQETSLDQPLPILRPPTFFGLIPWVNVYTVTRAFGGSEEGGWYYRRYTCVKSQQVWLWDAEVTEAMFLRNYKDLAWGLLCKEAAGQEVVVRVESRRAALEYKRKPDYDPEIVVESAVQMPAKSQLNIEQSKTSLIKKSINVSLNSIGQANHKLIQLVRTAPLNEELCERCKGSGRTRYLHIKNGICFLCDGSGKKSEQNQETLDTELSYT